MTDPKLNIKVIKFGTKYITIPCFLISLAMTVNHTFFQQNDDSMVMWTGILFLNFVIILVNKWRIEMYTKMLEPDPELVRQSKVDKLYGRD